jgi:hypothetical protein
MLNQGFSTGVSRHKSVPSNFSRCVAESWTFHHFGLFFLHLGVTSVFISNIVCRKLKKVENHCDRSCSVQRFKNTQNKIVLKTQKNTEVFGNQFLHLLVYI